MKPRVLTAALIAIVLLTLMGAAGTALALFGSQAMAIGNLVSAGVFARPPSPRPLRRPQRRHQRPRRRW